MVALLLLLGVCLGLSRRPFIKSWFRRGAPDPWTATSGPAPRGPVRPALVVLIDGLGERTAASLPNLRRACDRGLLLRVDVGFPSVSLPVQHVFWTGAWQQESGVQFVVERLSGPFFDSIPRQVARRSSSAVAVVESHDEIVRSFPFGRIIAPGPGEPPLSTLAIQQEALGLIQTSAALVFIHLLAVDAAGHRHGSASHQYRAAAMRADGLLSVLQEALPPSRDLLILSDHGHLPLPGGHGGVEPCVRWVRACLVGQGIPPGSEGVAGMPDLNRILAERLNVRTPHNSRGRTLSRVIGSTAAPERPSAWTFRSHMLLPLVMAGLLALTIILLMAAGGRRDAALLLPWGLALGLLLLVAGFHAPSLSVRYVYRIYSWPLMAAALPAALLPGLQLWSLRGRGSLTAAAGLLGCEILLPVMILLGLVGWPLQSPPLVPHLTAWTSVVMMLGSVSLVSLAAWALVLGRGPLTSSSAS